MSVITQTQINHWKKQHGSVYAISVDVTDIHEDQQEVVGYFKSPNLKTIAAAQSISGSSQIEACEVLFENSWLGGDELFANCPRTRMGAFEQLVQLTAPLKASVKKL